MKGAGRQNRNGQKRAAPFPDLLPFPSPVFPPQVCQDTVEAGKNTQVEVGTEGTISCQVNVSCHGQGLFIACG